MICRLQDDIFGRKHEAILINPFTLLMVISTVLAGVHIISI